MTEYALERFDPVVYLDEADALHNHELVLMISDGGCSGVLHPEELRSTLNMMKWDDFLPSLAHKAAHLFYGIITKHCFVDGNKRSAIALAALFLRKNQFNIGVARFFNDFEDISLCVAAGTIDKELLTQIFDAYLNDTLDSDESLLLQIFDAIEERERLSSAADANMETRPNDSNRRGL